MTLASETPSLTRVSLSALWSRQDALVCARVRVPGLSLRTRTRALSSRFTSAIQRAENTPQPAGSEDRAIGREILGCGNVLENGGATQSKKPISGPSVSKKGRPPPAAPHEGSWACGWGGQRQRPSAQYPVLAHFAALAAPPRRPPRVRAAAGAPLATFTSTTAHNPHSHQHRSGCSALR
jgi:hypothetical protein